jgi:phosphoserine aminotransferase
MLFKVIDESNGFYMSHTAKEFRSRVNVCFRIRDAEKETEAKFIKEADALKMINTGGHPANPGVRISMYNAMPVEGVVALCKFMREFQAANQ